MSFCSERLHVNNLKCVKGSESVCVCVCVCVNFYAISPYLKIPAKVGFGVNQFSRYIFCC